MLLLPQPNRLYKKNVIGQNWSIPKASASRESLLPSPSPRSSRKFGLGQETDVTRALDDQGLLSLQKSTLGQQEEMINSLSSVVSRQKEIGLAINQELTAQNRLLEDVDEGMERIGTNMGSANKRLSRIHKGK